MQKKKASGRPAIRPLRSVNRKKRNLTVLPVGTYHYHCTCTGTNINLVLGFAMASLMPRPSKNKKPPRPATKAPGTWTEQDFAGSGLLAYARNSLDKKQQQQTKNNREETESQTASTPSVNRLSRRLQALTKKRTSQKTSSANPSRTTATTPSPDTSNSALAAALLSTLQASQPTVNINRQSRRGQALNKNNT